MDVSSLVESAAVFAVCLLLGVARTRAAARTGLTDGMVRVHANVWFLSFLVVGMSAAVLMAVASGYGFVVVSRHLSHVSTEALLPLALSILGTGTGVYCVREISSAIRHDVCLDRSGISSRALGLDRCWANVRAVAVPNLTALRLTFDDGVVLELRDHMNGWVGALELVDTCVDASRFDPGSRERLSRLAVRYAMR